MYDAPASSAKVCRKVQQSLKKTQLRNCLAKQANKEDLTRKTTVGQKKDLLIVFSARSGSFFAKEKLWPVILFLEQIGDVNLFPLKLNSKSLLLYLSSQCFLDV